MHLCFHPTYATRPLLLSACAAAVLFGLTPSAADGQTFTSTLHSVYQAVFDDGNTNWPPGGAAKYPIEMTGVVINNPWDMLNYSNDVSQPAWQVFIQATDPNDFGGTALYMRKKIPWNSSQDYTDAEWNAEMQRLNYPGGIDMPLQRGDLITMQALAPGMFYNGKNNINEMHLKSPEYDFYITIDGRGLTPYATPVALSDLKNPDNTFIFNDTRVTGCEHYQGSLVYLTGLLLDPNATWQLDGTVTVLQGGLTFDMKLGIDPGLAAVDADMLKTTPFSVTAILDQEGSNWKADYRLWLTNAGDLMPIPEPGTAMMVLIAAIAGLVAPRRRRS